MSTNHHDSGLSMDAHRLAVTLVAAAYQGDDRQVQAVIEVAAGDAVTAAAGPDFHGFILGLVGLVEHALRFDPGAELAECLQAYRVVLDDAELGDDSREDCNE